MKKEYKGFAETMMQLYDLATELAPKEGKSHRETFDLVCQYLELESTIDQQGKLLEEKHKHIHELNKQIRDRKGTLALLQAIQEGKIGFG